MRKLIAAINITLDGFCDHTSAIADEELHEHYTDMINNAGTILYGRITYQLMEFWQPFVKNPTGKKDMDDFAMAIDRIPKIVFSRTLKSVTWESAKLAAKSFKEVVLELKQQDGKDIFVASPSLIVTAKNLNLIDEYQLCVHPVIAGSGLPLFKNVNEKSILNLISTKRFGSGAIVLCYKV